MTPDDLISHAQSETARAEQGTGRATRNDSEGCEMTKEQIEADIIHFQSLAGFSYGLPDRVELYDRAIARLRADLTRMEGPAPGTRRIWIEIVRGRGQALIGATLFAGPVEACQKDAVFVVADIPLRRVVEVEGVVEEAGR